MALQNQKYITLDSCIYDYINEAEISQNKYFKLFHIAFRVFELLGMDFFYQIKSVMIPKNANNTITLPPDCLNYTKLGVKNGAGELVPLKYNDKLTTFADLRSNRIESVQADNFANFYSYSSPVFFNYWNGDNYENLYGVVCDGFYGGGFKIDDANGVILLDPSFNYNELVLEYTASPVPGADYQVPIAFREAVISWLAWKDIANTASKSHMALGNIDRRRHEFFEARRRGIAQFRPFYLDQAYLINLENQRMVVKA